MTVAPLITPKNFLDEAATKSASSSNTKTPSQLCGIELMPHQKVGLDFLIRMEKDATKRGGILCDDMGLGKTIQALALIVSRPYKKKKAAPGSIKEGKLKSRATLIVAPVAILRQWQSEIKQFTNPELKVLVFHGKRTKHPEDLLDYDVIVTGYPTIRSELPDEGDARGPLSSVFFHRIILDEAHAIRNCNSSTAKSCSRLNGKYRWCLTATPLQNSIRDLYSLVHFLRIEPYCYKTHFDKSIGKSLSGTAKAETRQSEEYNEAIEVVRALFKSIALRRTKASKIDGKCIVELPKKNIEMIHAKMSRYERQVYNYISSYGFLKRSKRKNKVGLKGVIDDDDDDDDSDLDDMDMVSILEQNPDLTSEEQQFRLAARLQTSLGIIIRLRQACLHPRFLVDNPKHEHYDATLPYTIRFKYTGDINVDQTFIVEDLWNKIKKQRILCQKCRVFKLEPQWVIQCGHMLCHKCFRRGFYNDKLELKSDSKCIVCRDDAYFAFAVPVQKALNEARAHHQELAVRKNVALPVDPSSTKIDVMLEILAKTKRKTRNKDKTIIFSQFTSYLDMLEEPLRAAQYKFLRFDGKMSLEQRDEVLRKFSGDPKATVLLASTMCASVGLNLVAANHVIMMDVWWNPAVESQAIDRVYRIGQTKEVFIYRIIMKNTVEDSILDMQMGKKKLIERALNDDRSEMDVLSQLLKKLNLGH